MQTLRDAGLLLIFALLAHAPSAASSETQFDSLGRLTTLALGHGWIPLKTTVKAPLKGWERSWGPVEKKTTHAQKAGTENWQYKLGENDYSDLEVIQVVREKNAALEFELRAHALNDCNLEGLIFEVRCSPDLFGGGYFVGEGKDGKSGFLPPEKIDPPHILSGTLRSLNLHSPKQAQGDGPGFALEFDHPVNVTLQDERKWGGAFSILIYLHQGELLRGDSAALTVTLTPLGDVESTPAEFTLDATKALGVFQGTGGNYCFNIEAPETQLTLDKLTPAYARTEMTLTAWMPHEDGEPDLALPGKLKAEFALMRELAERKIPFIVSAWHAPEWMLEQRSEINEWNPDGPTVVRPHLKAATLDKAVAAITAYLLHAKNESNAEPEYFSFNEPDCGAHVKFTGKEHAEFIKRAGAAFAAAKLKTRLLLGDVCHPRGSEKFIAAALADADAMKYAGAIAFHSWGGATPAEYEAWSALAAARNLPLFCCEAGVDSAAWKDGRYRSENYAILEAAHYNDLFRYARPRNILYWEYTSDYSLLQMEADGLKGRSEDSPRFAQQKQWQRYIPAGSEFLALSGEHPSVTLSAFRGRVGEGTVYTLNAANTAWEREVVVKGIPNEVVKLNVIETSPSGALLKRPAVAVKGGEVRVKMPKRGLVTLTTMGE